VKALSPEIHGTHTVYQRPIKCYIIKSILSTPQEYFVPLPETPVKVALSYRFERRIPSKIKVIYYNVGVLSFIFSIKS